LGDGRTMNATDSAGFKITNFFGGVLDEKLVGEKHLQAGPPGRRPSALTPNP
jgi:hypothetical protein